jgi:hypothetical protein
MRDSSPQFQQGFFQKCAEAGMSQYQAACLYKEAGGLLSRLLGHVSPSPSTARQVKDFMRGLFFREDSHTNALRKAVDMAQRDKEKFSERWWRGFPYNSQEDFRRATRRADFSVDTSRRAWEALEKAGPSSRANLAGKVTTSGGAVGAALQRLFGGSRDE